MTFFRRKKENDEESAIKEFRSTTNGKIQEWNKKGIQQVEEKNYEDAMKCFDNAIKLDPMLANKNGIVSYIAQAWNNKGKVLALLGKHEDANACLMISLELTHNNITQNEHYQMGLKGHDYFFHLSEPTVKIDVTRKIDCEECWLEVCWRSANALSLHEIGGMEESIEWIDHVIEFMEKKYEPILQHHRPKNNLPPVYDDKMSSVVRYEIERLVDALLGKGKTLQSLGRDQEADECFERATWYHPNYTASYVVRDRDVQGREVVSNYGKYHTPETYNYR